MGKDRRHTVSSPSTRKSSQSPAGRLKSVPKPKCLPSTPVISKDSIPGRPPKLITDLDGPADPYDSPNEGLGPEDFRRAKIPDSLLDKSGKIIKTTAKQRRDIWPYSERKPDWKVRAMWKIGRNFAASVYPWAYRPSDGLPFAEYDWAPMRTADRFAQLGQSSIEATLAGEKKPSGKPAQAPISSVNCKQSSPPIKRSRSSLYERPTSEPSSSGSSSDDDTCGSSSSSSAVSSSSSSAASSSSSSAASSSPRPPSISTPKTRSMTKYRTAGFVPINKRNRSPDYSEEYSGYRREGNTVRVDDAVFELRSQPLPEGRRSFASIERGSERTKRPCRDASGSYFQEHPSTPEINADIDEVLQSVNMMGSPAKGTRSQKKAQEPAPHPTINTAAIEGKSRATESRPSTGNLDEDKLIHTPPKTAKNTKVQKCVKQSSKDCPPIVPKRGIKQDVAWLAAQEYNKSNAVAEAGVASGKSPRSSARRKTATKEARKDAGTNTTSTAHRMNDAVEQKRGAAEISAPKSKPSPKGKRKAELDSSKAEQQNHTQSDLKTTEPPLTRRAARRCQTLPPPSFPRLYSPSPSEEDFLENDAVGYEHGPQPQELQQVLADTFCQTHYGEAQYDDFNDHWLPPSGSHIAFCQHGHEIPAEHLQQVCEQQYQQFWTAFPQQAIIDDPGAYTNHVSEVEDQALPHAVDSNVHQEASSISRSTRSPSYDHLLDYGKYSSSPATSEGPPPPTYTPLTSDPPLASDGFRSFHTSDVDPDLHSRQTSSSVNSSVNSTLPPPYAHATVALPEVEAPITAPSSQHLRQSIEKTTVSPTFSYTTARTHLTPVTLSQRQQWHPVPDQLPSTQYQPAEVSAVDVGPARLASTQPTDKGQETYDALVAATLEQQKMQSQRQGRWPPGPAAAATAAAAAHLPHHSVPSLAPAVVAADGAISAKSAAEADTSALSKSAQKKARKRAEKTEMAKTQAETQLEIELERAVEGQVPHQLHASETLPMQFAEANDLYFDLERAMEGQVPGQPPVNEIFQVLQLREAEAEADDLYGVTPKPPSTTHMLLPAAEMETGTNVVDTSMQEVNVIAGLSVAKGQMTEAPTPAATTAAVEGAPQAPDNQDLLSEFKQLKQAVLSITAQQSVASHGTNNNNHNNRNKQKQKNKNKNRKRNERGNKNKSKIQPRPPPHPQQHHPQQNFPRPPRGHESTAIPPHHHHCPNSAPQSNKPYLHHRQHRPYHARPKPAPEPKPLPNRHIKFTEADGKLYQRDLGRDEVGNVCENVARRRSAYGQCLARGRR